MDQDLTYNLLSATSYNTGFDVSVQQTAREFSVKLPHSQGHLVWLPGNFSIGSGASAITVRTNEYTYTYKFYHVTHTA
jgi:hypothetical protein